MTVVLQFEKHIQKLDILIDQLQIACPNLITNGTRRSDTIYIECSKEPTSEESTIIAQAVERFDDTMYDGMDTEKPLNLLSTTKDVDNVNYWTLVCKWQYQGRYVELINKVIISYSIVSNDVHGNMFVRVFDSSNNKVIALSQEENSHDSKQIEIPIENADLPYLPAVLEIHVKLSSDKDVASFQNITALYAI